MNRTEKNITTLVARVALSAAFLSAVADRFGLWGPNGAPDVAWGDFAHFTAYTAKLNPFLPGGLIGLAAWLATVAELGVGVLLSVGLFSRVTAISAGVLLCLFFLTMSLALGLKAPLNYSVLSAAAAAFQLGLLGPGEWSLDALRNNRARTAQRQ